MCIYIFLLVKIKSFLFNAFKKKKKLNKYMYSVYLSLSDIFKEKIMAAVTSNVDGI